MAAIYRSLLAAAASAGLAAAEISTRACNNSPELCSRAYNNVTYLGAHDSAFVRNASNGYSVAGNQFFTSPVQLDGGVRLLTSQIHKAGGELHLCHSYCQLYDAGTVSGWLSSIRSWLDMNPNEVVTLLLVNGDNVSAADINKEFVTASIAHYAYTPADTTKPTTDWPTLDELIDMNKRLIVFIQPLAPRINTEAKYLLDQFTFTFENDYDNTSPQDFSCTANRPDSLRGKTAQAVSSGRLPILNHFLYDQIGSTDIEIPAVESADDTNALSTKTGNLGDAATTCAKEYGKNPNYLLVDFFNVGPAIASADKLNGLVAGDIVGRRALPDSTYMSGPGPSQTAPLPHPLPAGMTSSALPSQTSAALMPKLSQGGGDLNAGSGISVPSPGTLLGSILGVPLVGAVGAAFG